MKYIFSFWLIVRTCGQNIHKLAGRPNLLLHLVPPFLKTGLKLDFAIDVYIVFVDSNLTQDLEAVLAYSPLGCQWVQERQNQLEGDNKVILAHVFCIWSNPTKWTHLGAVAATVGVTLLHIIKNISN